MRGNSREARISELVEGVEFTGGGPRVEREPQRDKPWGMKAEGDVVPDIYGPGQGGDVNSPTTHMAANAGPE